MFQVIVTRVSFWLPCLSIVALGVLVFQTPSAWLLLAYAAYRFMRAGGMGDSLGYRELARLDTAFVGALVAITGVYAILCRGVAISGIVCLGILTGLFLRGFAATSARPGWLARAVIAFAWAALCYRFFAPTNAWGFCHCMINNVG